MPSKREVHEFAQKYYYLYSSPKTVEDDVIIGFVNKCFELEFEMDSGGAFTAKYGQDAYSFASRFQAISKDIDDYMFLGSAIFSKWRYITKWKKGQSPIDKENREWFKLAFARLTEITKGR